MITIELYADIFSSFSFAALHSVMVQLSVKMWFFVGGLGGILVRYSAVDWVEEATVFQVK